MKAPYRRLFRGLTQVDVEQWERDRFYRDEARWNREQEVGDARRDERQAREIRELDQDDER